MPKGYWPLIKKDKEHQIIWDEKTKSQNPLANTNQPQTQTQASKKSKYYGNHWNHLATGVNAIEMWKKDKDKNEIKRTWATSNVTLVSRNITMLTSMPKNLEISDGYGYFHMDH